MQVRSTTFRKDFPTLSLQRPFPPIIEKKDSFFHQSIYQQRLFYTKVSNYKMSFFQLQI